MKTLYSSAFLSVILGFFVLFPSDQPLQNIEANQNHRFYNIYKDQNIRSEDQMLAIEVFERFDSIESQRFSKEILPMLRERYEGNDQVSLKVYNVSDSERQDEVELAKALSCASGQDRFWDFHELLHEQEGLVDKSIVDDLVISMEMDIEAFNLCFDAEETLTDLEEARIMAEQRKITIYPTVLINDWRMIHYQPWENVKRVLDQFKI